MSISILIMFCFLCVDFLSVNLFRLSSAEITFKANIVWHFGGETKSASACPCATNISSSDRVQHLIIERVTPQFHSNLTLSCSNAKIETIPEWRERKH